MKKQLFLLLLLGLVSLVMFSEGVKAATCTVYLNGTQLSANGQVLTTNATTFELRNASVILGYNISSVRVNFTNLDGKNAVSFTNVTNNITASQSLNVSLPLSLHALSEQKYTVNITAYNNTGIVGTVNSTQTFCSLQFTNIVIDAFDIAVPTQNAPVANIEVTTLGENTIFNISSGRTHEQIDSAVLYIGGNSYTMTAETTNGTVFTYTATRIPESAYNWYAIVTDTDGTTTARTTAQIITFKYQGGRSQLPEQYLLEAQGKTTTEDTSLMTLIILAGGAYLLFFYNKK